MSNDFETHRQRAEREEQEDLAVARASALWPKAVVYLREQMPSAVQALIRDALPTPDGLIPYHCWWGMTVRNSLRTANFGEEAFKVRNLDNIYIALVVEAVAPGNQEGR